MKNPIQAIFLSSDAHTLQMTSKARLCEKILQGEGMASFAWLCVEVKLKRALTVTLVVHIYHALLQVIDV